jgi:hypothetical protein
MVDISIPQKPHFLPFFWSSLTTGACRLLRPTSGTREAFFRLLVQRYEKNAQYARVRPSLEQTFFLWVKGEMSWIEKAVIKVNVIVGQNPSGDGSKSL